MRLDRWFKTHYAGLPHSRLEKLLRTGQVRVDGGRAKASTRLAEGQTVRVPPLPDVAAAACAEAHSCRRPTATFSPSITLYEDDDCCAQQAVGDRGAGRHQDAASYRPAARRHGRRAGDAAAARASARPRHVRRAGGRQAPLGRGEARHAPSRPARCARSIGRWCMACRSRRKARSRRPWSRRRDRKATACARRAPASRMSRSRR